MTVLKKIRETLISTFLLFLMPQTGIELLWTQKNRIEMRIVPSLLIVVQDLYNFFVQTESTFHTVIFYIKHFIKIHYHQDNAS